MFDNDWQYHQDGQDMAAGVGCLGLIALGVAFAVVIALCILS